MIGRILAVSVGALALLGPARAFGDQASDLSRAESLFRSGKLIRDAGFYADACPLFAQSSRLARGVGVLLYLGDCDEHEGRTASAWTAFRDAESLARQRDDSRAEIAHTRADALAGQLSRLTIVVPKGSSEAPQVSLDGALIPPDAWNAALAVDPGDHAITVVSAGRTSRVLTAHVAAAGTSEARVELAEPVAATPPASDPAPSGASPGNPAAATGHPSSAADAAATRRWIGVGLLAAGAVGIAVGTSIVLDQSGSTGSASCCAPTDNTAAGVGSFLAFATGGAALVAGLALTVSAPARSGVGWTASPVWMAGGGGAMVRAGF